MTNKHEWVGTSGLKQLLLMLVGFIYLLWQWQVMQRKGVQLPQHVQLNRCFPNAVERAGAREWDCIRMNKGVLLAWHFWRWYSSSSVSLITSSKPRLLRGDNHRQTRKNTINAMQQLWCMLRHGNMNVFWLMQLQTDGFGSFWTKGSIPNSNYEFK